jgi:hypothetical protein
MKNRKILLLTFQASQVSQIPKASNHMLRTSLRNLMDMVDNTSTKLHIITTTTNSSILNQKR